VAGELRRETTETESYGLVEEGLYHQLFPQSHPYYASVAGSHSHIGSARLRDLREFPLRYYSPNKMRVCETATMLAPTLETGIRPIHIAPPIRCLYQLPLPNTFPVPLFLGCVS
jgi:hypothetical protein